MGSLASDDPSADALIINAVDRTLCSQRFGTASRVVIYKADADGSILDHDALESELVAQQTPGARRLVSTSGRWLKFEDDAPEDYTCGSGAGEDCFSESSMSTRHPPTTRRHGKRMWSATRST